VGTASRKPASRHHSEAAYPLSERLRTWIIFGTAAWTQNVFGRGSHSFWIALDIEYVARAHLPEDLAIGCEMFSARKNGPKS
jgi:hypothetical protein